MQAEKDFNTDHLKFEFTQKTESDEIVFTVTKKK
jgi:hypothetical protein